MNIVYHYVESKKPSTNPNGSTIPVDPNVIPLHKNQIIELVANVYTRGVMDSSVINKLPFQTDRNNLIAAHVNEILTELNLLP